MTERQRELVLADLWAELWELRHQVEMLTEERDKYHGMYLRTEQFRSEDAANALDDNAWTARRLLHTTTHLRKVEAERDALRQALHGLIAWVEREAWTPPDSYSQPDTDDGTVVTSADLLAELRAALAADPAETER